jgi:DNA-binding NarL/FixJ family response regulator
MDNACKIVLVDDHNLFRDGLKYVLGQDESLSVVAEASDGLEFLELMKYTSPDVVLMDISMPNMNGIEATTRALELYPGLKVIALSMFGDENYCISMLQAGARGFILKDSGFEDLLKAINKVIKGESYFSNSIINSLIKAQINGSKKEVKEEPLVLSGREIEILRLICEGLSNKEISLELKISQRTIEGIRSGLLQKTGSKDSVNLALFALKNNLLK